MRRSRQLQPRLCSSHLPLPPVHYAPDLVGRVPPSLDEQFLYSDVIVRASLLSATGTTEAVPSDPGVASTYRAVQELRFTTHEYLKGTGPAQLVVVVRGKHTYATGAEAQKTPDNAVSRRNTTWDGRQGVIFLETPRPPYPSGVESGTFQRGATTTPAFAFTHYNAEPPGVADWDYSVDTVSRAWLPASDDGSATSSSSARSSNADGMVFITDGSVSPPPVISLTDLRTRITEFETMMAAGAGIEGFAKCVRRKIGRERHRRAVPWTPFHEEATLDSGSDAGIEVNSFVRQHRDPEYDNFRLLGSDAAVFQTLRVDDDSDPSNGYAQTIVTARPLPEGVYSFQDHWQRHTQVPCNFVPDDAYTEWTVTVTARDDTLHEAFFDPATTKSAVGASGTHGTLNPAAFSLDGSTTTISGLWWDNDSVVLSLSPHTTLSGHELSFIELDGSVSLTLKTDSATSTTASNTLSWSVPNQPWHPGDQLMLRITELFPEVSISDLDSPIIQGQSDSFSVSTLNLLPNSNYTVEVRSSRVDLGFDDACVVGDSNLTVPQGSLSLSWPLTLHACYIPGATITAKLLKGRTP